MISGVPKGGEVRGYIPPHWIFFVNFNLLDITIDVYKHLYMDMDITFKIISNKLLLTNYFPLAIINIHYTDYTDYRSVIMYSCS